MPCSICRQAGHNRSTCPQQTQQTQQTQSSEQTQQTQQNITGIPLQRTHGAPPGSQEMWDNARVRQSNSSRRVRKRWKKTIKDVINLKRYAYIVNKWSHLGYDDSRIYYPSWLKVKDLKGHLTDEINNHWKYRIYIGRRRWPRSVSSHQIISVYRCVRNSCFLLHREMNPEPVQVPTNQDLHLVNLVNLRDTNYLVYWVIGNYMIQDIDTQVNNIKFMGLSLKSGKFPLKTMTGHRFYLVPHRLDVAPPYHPETDKQFFIEPYLQINIHDGSGDTIYIDDKDKLSELNKWKFNALKLDYLIKEVIKLGGKNNDSLECVLDLHEDIQLDTVNEWLKDVAGIPSVFTNLT